MFGTEQAPGEPETASAVIRREAVRLILGLRHDPIANGGVGP